VINRGAFYADGKIIYNLLDGHTVAVDAESGKEIWRTQIADVAEGETTPMAPFLINFKVTWQVLLAAFGISVGVGVLAGFVPAIRSSQVRIVDGLRQVV
jgi:ABC-type antimicrobial peptide transport system permease subunit